MIFFSFSVFSRHIYSNFWGNSLGNDAALKEYSGQGGRVRIEENRSPPFSTRLRTNGGTSPLPLYDCMAYPSASKIRIGWTDYLLWRHNLWPSDRKSRVFKPSPCFCCMLTSGTFRRPSVTKVHGIITKRKTKCDWRLQSFFKDINSWTMPFYVVFITDVSIYRN